MSRVFIHRLYENELGYRKGVPQEAGGFILIVKEVQPFFPLLSKAIPEDSIPLTFQFPQFGREFVLRYVYHNSKFHGTGSRRERRIYLTVIREALPHEMQPGNFLVVTQRTTVAGTVYEANVIRQNTVVGKSLDALLGTGDNNLLTDTLDLQGYKAPMVADDAELAPMIDSVIDPDTTSDLLAQPLFLSEEQVKKTLVTKPVRDPAFTSQLLNAYDRRCSITGEVIRYNKNVSVQACHIVPRAHLGSDNPRNGIVLSRDLHWAFDRGYFCIHADYRIEQHSKVSENSVVSALDGMTLRTPSESRFHPFQEALTWHRKNVFGLFQKSTRVDKEDLLEPQS